MNKEKSHEVKMIKRQNELNLYDFGHYYGEKICDDADKLKEEYKDIPEPTRLKEWFAEYSKELEKEANRRLRKMKLKKYASRAAVVFLAILLSSTVVTMSVEAFRVRFLNWFIESEKDHNRVEFESSNQVLELPGEWRNYYYPTYIPEGYFLIDANGNDLLKTILLTNDGGKLLLISQAKGNMGLNIDSEDTDTATITINDVEALLTEKSNQITITWAYQGVIFTVEGEEDINIMIQISEKLKKVLD